MGIQSILSQDAIAMLPIVQAAIASSPDDFCINQMVCATEKACMDSGICITSMSKDELDTFQSDLINKFKARRWASASEEELEELEGKGWTIAPKTTSRGD